MNEFSPKNIDEAIELWLSQDAENAEVDLIISIEKRKIDWLHNNLKRRIIDLFALEDNAKLRQACGSKDMSPDAAALIITAALWDYWHYTP